MSDPAISNPAITRPAISNVASTSGIASLRHADRVIWATIAAIAAMAFAAPWASDFRIVWPSFALPAAATAILVAGAWFYRGWRSDPKLETALGGTAQIVAFAAVAAPLSYLAASLNRPLHDDVFAAADQALGVDWMALLAWMNAHPLLHAPFVLAYFSFTVQAAATVLALAFTGRLVQSRVFMISFILAALVCIAISAILPAQGVWEFYQFKPGDFPALVPATRGAQMFFDGLRDGSYRLMTGISSEGIITFPSFHAALGVIFMVALWSIPIFRWVGAVLNITMILATPIDGGHYFVDVIAGVVIAIFCVVAARQIVVIAESRHSFPGVRAIKPPKTIH